jgi:hypothetical protein
MQGDLMQVMNSLKAWKWKLSASGFFTIDRSLVSGVCLLSFSHKNLTDINERSFSLNYLLIHTIIIALILNLCMHLQIISVLLAYTVILFQLQLG